MGTEDERIGTLYERVKLLQPQEREKVLREHEAIDREAVQRVRALFEEPATSDWVAAGADALIKAVTAPLFGNFDNPRIVFAHDFVLQAFLGKGGQAEVYKAYDVKSDRHVAIKVFRGPGAAAEARRMGAAAINTDYFVTLHHSGQTDSGLSYIVMEFADGETLSKCLDGEPPNAKQIDLAVDRILPIIRALDGYHGSNEHAVHRDIKPENILLIRGRAKLTDFGITQPGGGTPDYAAPEVRHGGDGPGVDIYSLGATLFALTTGDRPPPCPLSQTSEKIWPPNPRNLNPNVCRRLARVIGKAMDRDPSLRYARAGQLADDLQRWRARRPTSLDSWNDTFTLALRRNAIGLTILAGAAALLVITAFYLYRRDQINRLEQSKKLETMKDEKFKAVRAQLWSEARGLAAQGNWSSAMPKYEKLIDEKPNPSADASIETDRTRQEEFQLRIERLPGLLALDRIEDFSKEVTDLERHDVGRWRKALSLYRVELESFDASEPTRLRQGLADLASGGDPFLWDGDKDYAAALLAAHAGKADYLDRLKDSLLRNPQHFLARRALVLTLVYSGRGDEVLEHLDPLETHFPTSRSAKLARFSIEVLQVTSEQIQNVPLEKRLNVPDNWSPEDKEALLRFLQELKVSQVLLDKLSKNFYTPPARREANLAVVFLNTLNDPLIKSLGELLFEPGLLDGASKRLFRRLGIPRFVLKPFVQAIETVQELRILRYKPQEFLAEVELTLSRLDAAYRLYKDSTLLCFSSAIRFARLSYAVQDRNVSTARLSELSAQVTKDWDAKSSFTATSDVQYRSLALYALADIYLLRELSQGDRRVQKQLLNTLRLIAANGGDRPKVEKEVLGVVLDALRLPLDDATASRWKAAGRLEEWPKQKEMFVDNSRAFIAELNTTNSENKDYAFAKLAEVELWAEHTEEAYRRASKVISESKDPDARRVAEAVKEAVNKLRMKN